MLYSLNLVLRATRSVGCVENAGTDKLMGATSANKISVSSIPATLILKWTEALLGLRRPPST